MIVGALIGAAVGAGISIVTQVASGQSINWGEVGTQAAVGAVSGAIAGLAGPEAGPLGGLAAHALIGAASGMAGQLVNNAMEHKPLGDGVLMAGLIGGVTGGVARGGGPLLSKLLGKATSEAAGAAEDVARGLTREGGESVENAAGDDVASSCAVSGLSFAPSTVVATPKGEKPIASLKVGDHVTAYDPKTRKTTTQTVEHVWINHDTDLIDLTLRTDDAGARRAPEDLRKLRAALVGEAYGRAPPPVAHPAAAARDEVVHTTAKHPFLTVAGTWAPARQLADGMRVVREDGGPATVVGVRVVPGAGDMWNLTVSQVHTYAVGTGQYVVHNCGGGQGKVEAFRANSNLTNRARNVAYAKAEIDGMADEEVFATSGRSAGGSLPTPADAERLFATTMLQGYQDTSRDTEVKILEYFGSKFAGNPEVRGSIYLYTERAPCDSCTGVISQFIERFPNIHIGVDWG